MPDNTINFTNQGNASIYGKQVGIGQQNNNNLVPPEFIAEVEHSLGEIIKKYPNEDQALEVAKKDPKIKKRLDSVTALVTPIVLKETVSPLVRPLIEKLLNCWN
ncbi:MAG: hypothetical protein F6K17_26860 [Okeania sp. SIO3C4]|nr:hypothetical protein [Okeania sp. SIO3B3]NER05949.1 hypothetical protein [Okeania sp. SIO3C4]